MAALIPLLLMLALMWALLIRPQKAQLQRHRAFLESLELGDEVMTAGGMIGRVTSLGDRDAQVEIAPGVVVRVLKQRLLAVPGAADPGAADPATTPARDDLGTELGGDDEDGA